MVFIGKIEDLKEMMIDMSIDEKRAKHIVCIGANQRVLKVSQILGISGIINAGDRCGYTITLDSGETLFPYFESIISASKDRMWLSNKMRAWLADAEPISAEVH